MIRYFLLVIGWFFLLPVLAQDYDDSKRKNISLNFSLYPRLKNKISWRQTFFSSLPTSPYISRHFYHYQTGYQSPITKSYQVIIHQNLRIVINPWSNLELNLTNNYFSLRNYKDGLYTFGVSFIF